jgi:hypothetical protein
MEENQRKPVDPSVYREVKLAYKGSGQTLGELAAQTRQVEHELNAFYERIDARGEER